MKVKANPDNKKKSQRLIPSFPPDFRGPGETLGEVDPLSGGSKWWRGWRWLNDDVAVQGVHLALDPAVGVLWILLLVPCIVVFERVPLVVCIQAVLLYQGLGGGAAEERGSTALAQQN